MFCINEFFFWNYVFNFELHPVYNVGGTAYCIDKNRWYVKKDLVCVVYSLSEPNLPLNSDLQIVQHLKEIV